MGTRSEDLCALEALVHDLLSSLSAAARALHAWLTKELCLF